MKTMSKLLAVATLATGLNMASVPKANAGVFMAVLNPTVGLIIAFSGGMYIHANRNSLEGIETGFKIFMLDEKSNELQFNPIDSKTAAEMGLSEEERDSYNEEIDRVNATADEVNSDLLNAPKTEIEAIENKSLVKFQEQISPAAFSAVKKIVSASVQ